MVCPFLPFGSTTEAGGAGSIPAKTTWAFFDAHHVRAGQDKARRGVAWQGLAWRGPAGQGYGALLADAGVRVPRAHGAQRRAQGWAGLGVTWQGLAGLGEEKGRGGTHTWFESRSGTAHTMRLWLGGAWHG